MDPYTQTHAWIMQLPMFQKIGDQALKLDLENIEKICAYLKQPQQKFKSVHVGGTNGKGSTTHMVASVLQTQGYKVGLFTSPHLLNFRERVKVNGLLIEKDFIINFIETHRNFLDKQSLSFFEFNTALAFSYFEKKQVDWAVLEVGLGGAFDSTNIIKPEISIITNIGYDHMHILGDTLEKIAQTKAGIIKQETPIVVGEKLEHIAPIFIQKAKEQNAPLYFAEQMPDFPDVKIDLEGLYQTKNRQTVYAAMHILKDKGFNLSEENIVQGIAKTRKNTGLKGRWEVVGKQPKIICDTAHNQHAFKHISKQLNSVPPEQLHFVLGFVSNKDVRSIFEILPKDAHYYFCKARISRAMSIEALKENVGDLFENTLFFDDVQSAFKKAKFIAKQNDTIFIGGSTFIVSDFFS